MKEIPKPMPRALPVHNFKQLHRGNRVYTVNQDGSVSFVAFENQRQDVR